MKRQEPLNDETTEKPEVTDFGIKQSGKTHTSHLDTFLHDELYKSPLSRIKRLQSIFGDVYDITDNQWVDDFLSSEHPKYEIHRMECMAFVYLQAILNIDLTLDERKNFFNMIHEIVGFSSMQTDETTEKYVEEYVEEYTGRFMPKGLPSAITIFKSYCEVR